jgi:hypothetical protein
MIWIFSLLILFTNIIFIGFVINKMNEIESKLILANQFIDDKIIILEKANIQISKWLANINTSIYELIDEKKQWKL